MVAFAGPVVAFVIMLGESPAARAHYTTSWTWLSAGKYSFGFTLLTDQLSVMMMLIVAGVGSLIVAYSVGYMEGEDEERRYFAYMSLFVFSMLLLVQSGNLLLLLAGWGMVGLSSYLLIGFYQERPVVDRRREEGLRDERDQRRDDRARALPADPAHGPARLRRRLRRLAEGRHRREPDRARPARRRGREVGADPAPHLASRRDGGPDAGQRPDPRGDDGDRRRLPDRAHARALPERAARRRTSPRASAR